jgi:putative glutamine amidotransferase
MKTMQRVFTVWSLWIAFGHLSVFAVTVGMSHPSLTNLQRFVYLVEAGLIDAPDLKLVGVMHADQKGMYQAAQDYVESEGLDYISFEFIHAHEDVESLFEKNAYTEDFQRIWDGTDAFIFNGGADIPPVVYGEETFLTTGILEPVRLWELSFLFHLMGGERNPDQPPLLASRQDYVVLGICLGMQQINVAAGGAMVQDIPFHLYGVTSYEAYLNLPWENRHRNDLGKTCFLKEDVRTVHFHPLKLVDEGFLSQLPDAESALVLSAHHQAVKNIPEALRIVATSPDGKVVEALQHAKYPNVYGVQFHPEVTEIYTQKEIKNQQAASISLSAETKAFHNAFWQDFSRRLSTLHP